MTNTKKVNFELGELVRVTDNTFQEGISDTRIGVITEVGIDSSGLETGVYAVLFASSSGTLQMKFWHRFLEKVVL